MVDIEENYNTTLALFTLVYSQGLPPVNNGRPFHTMIALPPLSPGLPQQMAIPEE